MQVGRHERRTKNIYPFTTESLGDRIIGGDHLWIFDMIDFSQRRHNYFIILFILQYYFKFYICIILYIYIYICILFDFNFFLNLK